jgi:hypothetical protein
MSLNSARLLSLKDEAIEAAKSLVSDKPKKVKKPTSKVLKVGKIKIKTKK